MVDKYYSLWYNMGRLSRRQAEGEITTISGRAIVVDKSMPSISTKSLNKRGDKRGLHPNSVANLRPGNPPVDTNHNGYSITSTLKDLIHKEAEFIAPHARPKDKLWREQIAREILVKAAQGDVPMVKELLDRTEGKVPDKQLIANVDVVFIIGKGYKEIPQLKEAEH